MSEENEHDADGVGDFSQIFLYRVPKANHDAFGAVERDLTAIFKKHGVLGSDVFVLEEARVFQGFRDLRDVLGSTADEDVWVEVDHYRDAANSVRVIAEIGQDPGAGPLFGRVFQLSAQGFLCPQGNADRIRL